MIAEHINSNKLATCTNPMRTIALAYAKRGWPILPINGITDGICDCGQEHPIIHNGAHPCSYFTYLTATCDPAIIIGWFDRWPNMNFAVAPCRAHGGTERLLVIVEVAGDQTQGEQVMVNFAKLINVDLNICGYVLTPEGKLHIYVEVDATHDLDFSKIDGAKIYLKKCHVMAAGSRHQSGSTYKWQGDPLPTIPVIAGETSIGVSSGMIVTAIQGTVSQTLAPQQCQQTNTDDEAKANLTEPASTDFSEIARSINQRIAANRAAAAAYNNAGFKLCRIAIGGKAPLYKDWPNKSISINQVNHEGLGLIHAQSNTCAIDLDNFASAVAWFEERNIDLPALLAADDAVQIKSGRPNRGKLIYRLPKTTEPIPTVQVKNPDGSMLIEFRCAPADTNGAGIQDVLPPSIHPDTNMPYEWAGAGDFQNLPELPADVFALWQSLLATKVALKLPQPSSTVNAGYSIPEGGRSNALFKLGGNLARLGLSPEGIRAALLNENQKFCQPPLSEREVDGIAKSAAKNSYGAKEAASRLFIDDETDEEALALAKKAIAKTKAVYETSNDAKLLELPGTMRDIAAWNARTSRTIQPAFDLCTSLVACSSVLARDFVNDGSHTNLYTVAVGPSGCGKENALRTVNKIIDTYANDRRAGKPASDTSVLTVMGRNPASTFVIDELGEILQGVFSAKAANYQARIGTTFMDLFTKGGDAYRGTEYGIQDKTKTNGRERTDLFSPCPSIFGATTAVTLFKDMSCDVIGSGFFPRILYFRAPDNIPMPNFERKDEPMPEAIHAWLTAIKTRVADHVAEIKEKGDLIGIANHQYLPISVPYSAEAKLIVQQAQIDIVNRRNACSDELGSTMLTRVVENASRVALTIALATDPWAVEISGEQFQTALAIVTNAMQAFVADIRANLFDSQYAKIEVKAYEYIKKYFEQHNKPVGEGTLVDRCKPYGSALPSHREQVIKSLLAQGKITTKLGHKDAKLYLPRR